MHYGSNGNENIKCREHDEVQQTGSRHTLGKLVVGSVVQSLTSMSVNGETSMGSV